MSATVVVLGEDSRSHEDAAQRADAQHVEYRRNLITAIEQGADPKEIITFLEWYERAAGIAAQIYRRRARKLENVLRAALKTDLSDEHLGGVLGALYSATGERRRNPGGLSDHEQQIVDAYREADGEARHMLRMMAERLRRSTVKHDGVLEPIAEEQRGKVPS